MIGVPASCVLYMGRSHACLNHAWNSSPVTRKQIFQVGEPQLQPEAPSQRHSILPLSERHSSANRISRPPHYWEMPHLRLAGVWRPRARRRGICLERECGILARHHGNSCTFWRRIKASIVHHFHPHLHFWKGTDDWEITPRLTNGRMAWLHGLSTGKPFSWRQGREQIASHCLNYRARSFQLQSTRQEGDGKTSARVSSHHDGVKGKATAYSNQLSALICYIAKVGVQFTCEHWRIRLAGNRTWILHFWTTGMLISR